MAKIIEYIEAKKELEKMFAKPSDNRKIIFWYDSSKIFFDDISTDSFENCKVVVFNKNYFALKHLLEIEDIKNNYLIYIPDERPRDNDNWLLDILMYSEEYYADTVALTMRRLNITNSDLRRVVELHHKFFDSNERVKKLQSLFIIDDSTDENYFKNAMMSVIVKANYGNIDLILKELVFDEDGSKYNELVKYGFKEYIWSSICKAYNYEGQENINVLIKRFVMTVVKKTTNLSNLSSFYNQFIIENKGGEDAEVFVNSIKTDSRYMKLQERLYNELNITNLITTRGIDSLKECDVFKCFDKFIIDNIVNSLKNGSFDYDFFLKVIKDNRINSMWYAEFIYEYKVIESIISFNRALDNKIYSQMTSEEYIRSYTEVLYKIDLNYRHILTNYRSVDEPSEELQQLLSSVDNNYEHKFLDKIGGYFCDSLKSKNKDWSFKGLLKISDFYRETQKIMSKKLIVIISDGLRYEIGKDLVDEIKSDEVLKGKAEIDYAITLLPSETRFGMASLLPHKKIDYINGNVLVDDLNSSSTANRNNILNSRNESYAAIRFDEINDMSRNDIRQFMSDKSLLYIYHNQIDNTGENNENKVFDAAKDSIYDILKLVKKLYNSLQTANFFITADHGFIYRKNKIEESQKYGDIAHLNLLEASRRYIITDDENLNIDYTLEFNLNDVNSKTKVIIPYGYDLFKVKGSGIQYIHGGASLQEIIVPIIKISELRSSKLKDAIGPVGVRIKTINKKITNRSFSLEFEQYEKVEDKKQEISLVTYFVDENNQKISGEYNFIANSTSDDPETRVSKMRFALKNIEFNRDKRYYLILRDSSKDEQEYILKEQFIIDIINFKTF